MKIVGAFLWVILAAVACKGENDRRLRGVEYREAELSVVDMHLHTGRWEDLPPSFQENLQSNLPFPFNNSFLAKIFTNAMLSAKGIATNLWFSKVAHGVLFAVYAPETTGLTTNEFVHQQLLKEPGKFHGLASLPVDNWSTNEDAALDLLRSFLAIPGFIGMKLGHPHMKINLNDDRYYSIYGVANEFGVPVYVHTGKAATEGSLTNPEAIHPDFIEEAIQLFPGVPFILGHMGNGADFEGLEDPYDACFRLAAQYPNVYLEASALGSSTNDPEGENLLSVFRGAKERGLTDRMVYGSDGPQFPGFISSYLEATLTALDRADYSEEEAANVLLYNFLELFNLDERDVIS